jgi:hypothetical protein
MCRARGFGVGVRTRDALSGWASWTAELAISWSAGSARSQTGGPGHAHRFAKATEYPFVCGMDGQADRAGVAPGGSVRPQTYDLSRCVAHNVGGLVARRPVARLITAGAARAREAAYGIDP